MQPPTEQRSPAQLRGDEEDLYRRHHRDLRRAVTRVVNAPPELIEDACQSAWMKLLHNQPQRGTFLAWLRVVAIHEAYCLSAIEHRDAHLEDLAVGAGWDAVTPDPRSIDDAIEARAALRLLAALPAREREDLTLLIAGFTYEEIQQLTGGRTYTNVNKHLSKARARIRLLLLQAASEATTRTSASSPVNVRTTKPSLRSSR
jgi:RNA polymerase sigma factor (sigma-70 family)